MLVRCCVEYDLWAVLPHDLMDSFPVTHGANLHVECEALRLADRIFAAQLLLNLVDIVFVDIKQNHFARAAFCDLPT